MREIILYTVFLLLLIMQGCKNDDIIFDKNNLLLGNWEFQNSSEEFENTVYHMKRTKLLTEKYGTMKFSADGGFSWYQSTGFAGQLTLITGNWIAVNDSVIQFAVNPGLIDNFQIVVTQVNERELDYYHLYN